MVGASIGAALILGGLAVFAAQMSYWMENGRWLEYPLMDAVKSPAVKVYLPKALLSWLIRRESLYGLHEAVKWTLETLSTSAFLAVLGGLLLWRSVKS